MALRPADGGSGTTKEIERYMRKRLIWTLTLGAVVAIAFAGISMAKPVVVEPRQPGAQV